MPESTIYGQTAEEVRRFGLPCGGSVQVVLEPLSSQSQLRELLVCIEQHQRVERRLDMASGMVRMAAATDGDKLQFDGKSLTTVHGPRLRLLIIGGGQLSRYLATMAVMLDYQVTVCEPRVEYHEGWDAMAGVTLSALMPDDLVLAMRLDHNSAVVAVTHDPKLDDLALMEALRTPAFYVGALGSKRNQAARKKRLAEHFDLSSEELDRLHGPVGLQIGAKTPAEIAVSIAAEMVQAKNAVLTSVPAQPGCELA
jgi:xanthine dehydrogenase accessory factor